MFHESETKSEECNSTATEIFYKFVKNNQNLMLNKDDFFNIIVEKYNIDVEKECELYVKENKLFCSECVHEFVKFSYFSEKKRVKCKKCNYINFCDECFNYEIQKEEYINSCVYNYGAQWSNDKRIDCIVTCDKCHLKMISNSCKFCKNRICFRNYDSYGNCY